MADPVNINQVPKLNLGLQETDEVFITRGGSGPYRVPASSFPWEQKGDKGDPGGSWAPVLALVTDGARLVHRVVDWVGGTGEKPAALGYIGAAGIVATAAAAVDVRGAQGVAGWAPVLAVVADGERRVQQVVDWAGGAGDKPATLGYIGATGIVATAAAAVDVRGAQGVAGWAPVLAVVADGARRVQQVVDWTGGAGDKPATLGYVGATGIVATAAAAVDVRGAQGVAGWAPVLAVVADGERRVQQVVDWTGGAGDKPATLGYVGATGIVATAAAAVDVRGPLGSVTAGGILASLQAGPAETLRGIRDLVSQAWMLAYIDFTTKPDGAPPSALDSGQAADYVFNATGRRPVIVNGRLVVENQAAAGTGGLADYYQSDMGAPVTRVGCEWTQPAGADDGNGNITYAAWNSIYEGGGTNVARSWVHMSVVPGTGSTGTAKWSVCNGIGNLFVVKQQTFRNPTADGVAPWRSEALLDLDSGIAYAWLPDGSIMTVNNAEIAAMCATLGIATLTFADLASNVLMCEHFTLTGANTAKFGGIKSMWGETAASTSDGYKARMTQLQEMRAAAAAKAATPGYPAVVIYAPTTQLSVATTTSAASIDATNGKVMQVAGPLGKIIFQASAHYEWSATDVMFWRLAGAVNSATRAAAVGVSGQKGLVSQTIEVSGLTPGQSYSYILQQWSVTAGSATCKAGGTGGSMLPPLTILALPQ